MKSLLSLMLLLLAAPYPVDVFTRGVHAYREDRFGEALEAFNEAEKAEGFNASPELLHNKALAALRTGELLVAEYSAEKAAVRGGPEYAALRDFILGNTSFERCIKAKAKLDKPNVKPSEFAPAIDHANAALQSWQRAAASRSDWPEARRNVERALRKLQELAKKRQEVELQMKNRQEKKIEIQTDPLLQTDPDNRQPVSRVKPQLEELASDLVKRILDRLEVKEKQKLRLRRARQRLQRGEGEKDW